MRFFMTLAMALVSAAALSGPGLAQTADLVMTNGKIVTVDDQFSIKQALAVSGERILAVGSNAEIERLKGPSTRTIDLAGKTVIPGLIDNHAHFLRAGEYWDREVRLDGVTSHRKALEMLAEKVRASKPGEWVLVLGGWSEEQFTDEQRGFTRAELDAIAPNNPVVLQLIYFRIYANSAALRALGIDANSQDPPGGKIEKEANGEPNGVLNGAGALRVVLARLGEVDQEKMVENAKLLTRDLNRLGITAYQDMGGRGSTPAQLEAFRRLAERKELSVRTFYNLFGEARTTSEIERVLDAIGKLKPFQGNDYFQSTGVGESLIAAQSDNLLAATHNPSPEVMGQWRRMAELAAERGLHLNTHATLRGSIESFLQEIEQINARKPIRALRWTFSHLDQVEPQDLERMRRLGMYAQLHSRPTIQGILMQRVHGQRSRIMPPLRLVQDSGLPWGLGSDATAVTPSNPFQTLGWAVSGQMIGGAKVLDQTISREQALIAHTRSNARFLFQEANLGSLSPGLYADLLVLDRDYLSVPAEEIAAITPLLTMVGGKVVYEKR